MKRLMTFASCLFGLCGILAVHAQDVEYVGSTLWTAISDVKVVGNYAYCAFRNGLEILDVSNPAAPACIGRLYCQGMGSAMSGSAIDVSGDYVYLSVSGMGLQIINVSNPQNPILAGNYPVGAGDVFVAGTYAYILTGSGVQIIDVSNPQNPSLAGSYMIVNGAVNNIFVDGNHAYVTDGNNGLIIIDVSNHNNPTLSGIYSDAGNVLNVFVLNNYAYLVSYWDGFQILDVSNPQNPTLAGSWNVTDYLPYDVSVIGNFAYLADAFAGLVIVNVSDLQTPVLTGSCSLPGSAKQVFVDGDYAYVSDDWPSFSGYREYPGLQIVNISDVQNPALAGSYDTPDYFAGRVFVNGNYAYLASYLSLQIVNVSDPQGPTWVGSCNLPENALDVVVSGNYAYVADGTAGLQIVNVSNPQNPTLAGSYDTPDCAFAIVVSGNYAYIADGRGGGLQIINVSNPQNPTLAGSYDTPDHAVDISVAGDYAYIGDGSSLQIINISNPENPSWVGSYRTSNLWYPFVAVAGNYAYLGDYYGFTIVDISNPQSPTLVSVTPEYGDIDLGNVYDIFMADGYAYVADNFSGLLILDVSDPQYPTLAARYDTPGSADGVHVIGDHIYLADEYSFIILGFNPLDVENPVVESPRTFGLAQNYPNPFNATTTLSYTLDKTSPVELSIFNSLGQRAAVLLSGAQAAGEHRAIWDAAGFPSGSYYARLKSADQIRTIRMILLK